MKPSCQIGLLGMSVLFSYWADVVFFRSAPVPKYLKIHYVKEEIGDGKGTCEVQKHKAGIVAAFPSTEHYLPSSSQPLLTASLSSKHSTSLCSPLASRRHPHTGWLSAGTNTASCCLRSWGWLPREWPLGAPRRSDVVTHSLCANTWKADALLI